jgi:FKBP12-rapamycin complex-associated protein
MEHDVEALPINPSTLAELASKSHAYAKALHYRELQFQSHPSSCFESLIVINKKLDQHDAALGILKVAQNFAMKQSDQGEVTVHESWLAKLGYWEEALAMYEAKLAVNGNDDVEAVIGRLKCLDSLGRWEDVIELSSSVLSSNSVTNGQHIAKIAETGANAAWSLTEWSLVDKFVSKLSTDSVEASLLKAVLCTNSDDFVKAESYIDQTSKTSISLSQLL